MIKVLPSLLLPFRTIFESSKGAKINFRQWSLEEEKTITHCYEELGPAWSLISSKLKKRSASDCRKHWLNQKWMPFIMDKSKNLVKENDLTVTHSILQHDNSTLSNMETIDNSKLEKGTNLRKKDDIKTSVIEMPISSLFKSSDPLPKMTRDQKQHWSLLWKGYEKINHEWVLFPIETPGVYPPVKRISAELPHGKTRKEIVNKGWSIEEDMVLVEAFDEFGYDWKSIAYCLPRRKPEECRERLTLKYINLNYAE